MNPEISIIVPVYNVEPFLRESLNSIIYQTIGLEKLEVIMVDDCSTDGSKNIMEEYSNKFDNFISIYLEKNSGAAGKPRNIGIKRASGKYIMFLDPDDYYNLDASEILLRNIKNSDVDVVFGTYNKVFDDFKETIKFGLSNKVYFKNIVQKKRILGFSPSVWTKIIKKDLIIDNNISFPENIPGQDLVFMVRIFFESKNIKFVNKVICNYRIRNDSNMGSISFKRDFKYLNGLLKSYYMVYDICKNSNNIKYFTYILKSHINFWIKQFVLSDISIKEKKELFLKSKLLFDIYTQNNLNSYPFYLEYLINEINKENYDEAILLSTVFKDILSKQKDFKIKNLNINDSNFNKEVQMNLWNEFYSENSKNKLKFLISVIIPVFNVEKHIKECLDSIVNQSIGIENIEVIIVNDCTEDNSMEIVRKYALKYDSIKIIEHESNLGLGEARNTGLKYVTSDFISFIDSDDFISLNTYELALKRIINNKYDLFIYPYTLYDNERSICFETIHHEIFNNIGDINVSKCPEIIFSTSVCNKIFSKKFIKDLNFPIQLYEDNIVSANISFTANKIFLEDKCTYFYRQQTDKKSITNRIDKQKMFDLIKANIQLHNLKYKHDKMKKSIKWINIHFLDRAILGWLLEWEFSYNEISKIFNESYKFAKDISIEDINEFDSYFPNYKVYRKNLIKKIINNDFDSFIIEVESHQLKKEETLNIEKSLENADKILKSLDYKKCSLKSYQNNIKKLEKTTSDILKNLN